MSKLEVAAQFEETVQRLLAGERFELNEKDLSEAFELVATNLLGVRAIRRGHYFDGVVGLAAKTKAPRQLEFSGEMWVGSGGHVQWKEAFRATVWEAGPARHGYRIAIQVGDDRGEAMLYSAFN